MPSVTGGTPRRARLRPVLAALTAALAATLVTTGLATPAPERAEAASWSAPVFERTYGGRGAAAVYSWGIEHNPVTGEILVGDYWNFQVRRYGTDGHHRGSFFRSPAQRKGQPYTISVDPRNGDVYVPELGDGKPSGYIARYDKHGTYLGEIRVGARYWVWSHIDAQGTLWLADAHLSTPATPRVWRYRLPDGALLGSFEGGSTPESRLGRELHGIGTDAEGNVYVADAEHLVVRVYTPSGTWLRTFGSPGRGAGQFTGDLRGLAVDRERGLVYVVDAQASQIEVFTTAGQHVRSWGSEGQGPGQFADGGREVTVDAEGDVWVADYGNYRFMEFSSTGELLGTYPSPAAGPVPGGFAQPRDVAVDPEDGSLWVADSWNNRFQKLSADGALVGAWGKRNSHAPDGFDYPRAIAVDPATRNVWVSNTRDHVIRVYDRDGRYLFTYGDGIDSVRPGSFRWVMDVEFHGGRAYVTDYTSGYWKVLDAATGRELLAVKQRNSGVAVDPATGWLYVATWHEKRVMVYDADLRYRGHLGSGYLTNPWDVDVVGGTVYVTDSAKHRVLAFRTDGAYLGSWGTRGSGAGQLNQPSGISHDSAGDLYVADAGNDRIVKFDVGGTLPAGDEAAPVVDIVSPVNKGTVAVANPLVVEGAWSDDTRLSKVEVAYRDKTTLLWWDAATAVWRTNKTWNLAAVAGGTTSGSYRGYLNGAEPGGSYLVQTKATDVAGRVTVTKPVSTKVAAG